MADFAELAEYMRVVLMGRFETIAGIDLKPACLTSLERTELVACRTSICPKVFTASEDNEYDEYERP